MKNKLNASYRTLVIEILKHGELQECRNGEQLIIPSYSFTVDDMQNDHKLLLRKMYYKGVLGEFLTIIDPAPLTNVSQFEANGCNYWSEWAGPNGELKLDYHDELHPQLEEVIEGIKNDPNGRRHVISLWNYKNVLWGNLSLPCCWHNLTFSVINRTLHLTWTQRSVDTMVGLPSDVYLAYLFMNYVAEACDLDIGSCMFSLSNVHIYKAHIDNAYTLITKRTEEDYDKPLKFELYK
jgi:thymidylate synthase